jgi:predicted dehydrogenase
MQQAAHEDGAKPCRSYEELLDTPDLEAVVISTGAKFHAEQALAAMERGLHVFIEKPLCSTPDEVQALLQAQEKYSVVAGVGHNDHAHDAISLTIKNKIDSGELGAIASIEKTTAHNGGLHIKPGEWRGDPAKNPGGMLFQCGVHALHELMFYFGPVAKVSAMMRYDVHTTQTADVAVCNLQFASGLIGTLCAYHVTPYRHTFNVFGTKANLYREELFFQEGTKLWQQTTRLVSAEEPRVPVEIAGETDTCGNLRSWHNAIRTGSTLYPSLLDGARAVMVVFAAEESARTDRVVRVAVS